MAEREVKVYTRFNRLWHWSQAGSILLLFFTGARVMGLHTLMPFQLAVVLHSAVALALLLLWAFATFWLFTTGAWKQFLPSQMGLWKVLRFYAYGVFHGEQHPYRKILRRRHNPLQALAYLALKTVLFPAIWISGLAYLGYALWDDADTSGWGLWVVANIHLLAAFAIASFVVVHVYLLTIGHGFREHVRPMITGFERVTLTPEQEAYLRQEDPSLVKTDS
ncbi:cytochrome b/b6 domain-containing protein [Rhodobacter sp. Har01]|uniref:cytochrome b/b6 domain-containing protein n=1 Tax=Rhodobacter sp. Har01 TaxID=2883999 RepID=UPI001D091194|nr:cytochrome b/b6 domain-containing protein [Rhodobacter sp. Har01]MCB6178084.1 cytochrome b/b6 domain-containing protein [Rhodobacter sp. Har01]